MIEYILEDIERDCEFLITKEQLQTIKVHVANYALAALLDSEVAREAEKICVEAS